MEAIPCAKPPRKVPTVLSQDEVLRLFAGIHNLKHRLVVMTTYAAGLRASEVARLRVCDIDSRRMLIHVVQGKGRRDRLVPLSPALLALLREYYRVYRPENWLFTRHDRASRDRTRHLTTRSIQRIVNDVSRVVLGRRINTHALRHSCATHLLEAGVNVRIVQGFLGHQRLSTTDRYTHISREQITATKSPLDLISDAN
jgi:site-specific recombinase XerD